MEAGNGCSVSECVRLHPHVCLIVPAVRVETEVWQRARWVIRLSACALKVTASVYLHPAAARRPSAAVLKTSGQPEELAQSEGEAASRAGVQSVWSADTKLAALLSCRETLRL